MSVHRIVALFSVMAGLCATPMAEAQGLINCTGVVTGLIVYFDGQVTVNGTWRGDWTTVCNLNANYGSTTPQTCRAWYAPLLTAKTQQIKVTLQYTTDAVPACNSIATYGNAPAPQYIGAY